MTEFPPDEIDDYLTEEQVLAAHAEHGRLNWWMVAPGDHPVEALLRVFREQLT